MRAPKAGPRHAGFTLIEALVALSIFSFIGVAAYQLLSSTGKLKEGGEQRFRAMSGLQTAMRLLEEDVSQFARRDVALYGDERAPAFDASGDEAALELTRAGWRNPLGAARSSLQRVAWLLDDERRVVRRFRRQIDDMDPDERVERVMVEGVEELAFRYLDDKGKWLDEWPPDRGPATEAEKKEADPAPRAVEVRIVHEQIGEVLRVLPLR
jgi:general secretion pathway protein J